MKLLDLSIEVDERHVTTLSEVAKVAEELVVPLIVVGAMARDLILHHVYGARVKRATEDIDFGMQVGSWSEFDQLKKALCEKGFSEDKQVQRLIDPRGRVVDLVPFGTLQDVDANISFPPKGDLKMSVLGFQDAMDNSIRVIIQKDPHIEVSVVSPQGLVLLKIIAWEDRVREKRNKDAKDLAYLIDAYEKIADISDKAYEVNGLMEFYDWDLSLASAYLLGRDSKAIASGETADKVNEILDHALDEESPSELIVEMGHPDTHRQYKLLSAFNRGFKEYNNTELY